MEHLMLLVKVFLVLVALRDSSCKQQYALNVPRVLLPQVPSSGVKSNFTLTATHGCFTWSSTKPGVASVDAIVEENGRGGCSRSALVTAQSLQSIRLSTIIVAKEVGGGIGLRCDVFVDTISRIEITTRTRELLLEEEPERFELQAYDDEGNMFSALNGHILDWILLPDEEATDHQAEPDNIINFISFEESTYSTDPAIKKLEAEGLQGYTVLVAGVSTGSAKVQVNLVDKIWKNVKPSVVRLLVIENLMLQPCMDVYILPLSFVDYHIERRKHGHSEIVSLPSDQYYLHLSNQTVAELDVPKSRVTGLVLGYAEVVLYDKNMLHTPTSSKPTAGVHVVHPHHLAFSISPGNVWVLETGREYRISVHVFDKNNHKTILTGNVPLSTILPLTYLTVHFSSMNGSYHHVTARQRGSTHLLSTLSSMKHPISGDLYDLPNTVSKKQLLDVYDPVQVDPKRLVLLWDPDSEYRYEYTLKASGGSGTYVWSCDPEGVVSVASNGTLTTVSKGTALITAADIKNTVHYDQTEVFVVPPAKMLFLPSPVEAMIGESLALPLQVLGHVEGAESSPMPFTDCSNLNIHMTMSDSNIFNISKGRRDGVGVVTEGACMILVAMAINPGHTRLVVSYSYGSSISMEAVVTIAAYPPLVPVDPETVAVVALGSYKQVIFEGGPSPWILDRSKFYKKLLPENSDQVRIRLSDPTRVGVVQHVYHVTCLELGEQTLSIMVGNEPSLKNQFPAKKETATRISCALPVSMAIRPVLSDMPDCPLYNEDSNQVLQFPVLCGGELDLEVEVFDAENRPFDNFVSLHFVWDSSDDLLTIPHPSGIDHRGNHARVTVLLGNQTGTVVVMVTCLRHIENFLKDEDVTFEDSFSPEVKLSITLLLRNEPSLSPSSILLYNHPGNLAVVSILDGSRHFRINTLTKFPPAEVSYSSEEQEITIAPFSEGKMKLSVQDLCLDVNKVATVGVVVGGVYRIEVMVSDVVQVGNSTLACVRVLDSVEEPYSTAQLKFMNLQPHSKSAHISLYPATREHLQTPPMHSVCYVVEGVSVGSAYLSFNATISGGRLVSSKPKEIQVFDPLMLQPKAITLLPTATFQIQSSGGPKPQTSILYSVSNAVIADVSDSGLIHANIPGNTVVTGKVRVHDPSSDRPLTYSQDVVEVTVIKLSGVEIFIATPRLLSDVDVAIYARGLNGETPFTFASSLPGLDFQWSVSNMDALSLTSVYDRAGVSLEEERDFDAVLHTRNPGQGTVRLTVKCPPGLCVPDMATFTDQVEVQVLPPLTLLRPLSGHFLLPQNGRARIVTNREGVSRLSYQLLQGSEREKTSLISISKQGEVKAAAINGHAVVMVTESEAIFGLNQTIIVHVEVRPVSSLSITPLSLAQATPNSNHHAYPLGYSAEFIAHLHDSVGRRFDFANIPLSHRLNRFDIVLVSPVSGNTTYTIKATKQGDVIMRAWMSSTPHVEDYIRIRVGYAIIPSLAVIHLGSTVCFSTHLTEDKPGWWSVGEEGVVELLPDSGVGQAMAVGRTVVYHKIKEVIDTHTEITVAKVNHVAFNVSGNLKTFTNGERSSMLGNYRIPVEFLLPNDEPFSLIHSSPNKECLKHAANGDIDVSSIPFGGLYYIQQVPFRCQLQLTDRTGADAMATSYIEARAVFDPYTGQSFCELRPLDNPEGLASREGLRLSLKVTAFDLSNTYSVFSESLVIPFLPAFHLSRSGVMLGAMETTTEVTVTGLFHILQSLEVSYPYPLDAQKLSSPSPNTAVYRISLLPSFHSPPEPGFNPLNITFSSPSSQQEQLLAVTFLESDPSCPTTPTSVSPDTPIQTTPGKGISYPSSYLYYLIFIVVAIVLVTIVMCLALNRTSIDSKKGFSSHLPPGGSPPQSPLGPMATSPPLHSHPPQNLHASGYQGHSSFNVSGQHGRTLPTHTPIGHGSARSSPPQGGFNRTGFSSSPGQHGLFSQ